MSRSFLLSLLAASSACGRRRCGGSAWSAPAIVRGNLVFDGIPEQSALDGRPDRKLDAYLSAREARPSRIHRQGTGAHRHPLRRGRRSASRRSARGARRQITFMRDPVLARRHSRPIPTATRSSTSADSASDGNTQLYYQRVGEPHGAAAHRRQVDRRRRAMVLLRARDRLLHDRARHAAPATSTSSILTSGALPRLAVAATSAPGSARLVAGRPQAPAAQARLGVRGLLCTSSTSARDRSARSSPPPRRAPSRARNSRATAPACTSSRIATASMRGFAT